MQADVHQNGEVKRPPLALWTKRLVISLTILVWIVLIGVLFWLVGRMAQAFLLLTLGAILSFGIILFRGNAWWRILLLVVSALFVVLIGPSRIYLGEHWASDVLGSYLIWGVLLGIALWLYVQLKQRGVMQVRLRIIERSRLSNRQRWIFGPRIRSIPLRQFKSNCIHMMRTSCFM